MILFADKNTGEIVGTIAGRVHSDSHMKMRIGKNTERIVIQWKQTIDGEEEVIVEKMQEAGKDLEGNTLFKKIKVKEKIQKKHYEPDFLQKDLIMDIERGKKKLRDYKIDLKTKKLIAK